MIFKMSIQLRRNIDTIDEKKRPPEGRSFVE